MVQTTINVFSDKISGNFVAIHSITPAFTEWFKENPKAIHNIAAQVLRNMHRVGMLKDPKRTMTCGHRSQENESIQITHIVARNSDNSVVVTPEFAFPPLRVTANYPTRGETVGTMTIEEFVPTEPEIREMNAFVKLLTTNPKRDATMVVDVS
jgi:hypothetical protein